jgi:hypothetical protein
MAAVLEVLVLVVAIAGGWAVLATLFTPPLTSGWREGMAGVMRRLPKAVGVVGLGVGVCVAVWVLVRH